MQRSRTELRRATDLAAKAASLSLSIYSDESIARQVAMDVASENDVAGSELKLDFNDVVFGNASEKGDGTFGFLADASPMNSVRILGSRTADSPSGAINTYFGALYASPTFEPTFSATAAFVNTDICLVLDRSGSMKWNVIGGGPDDTPNRCLLPTSDCRWRALESAVNSFVDVMESSPADEKVAMVTFATENSLCGTNIPVVSVDQPLSSNLTNIRSSMADRSSSVWWGGTDIARGIEEGQAVLTSSDARPTAYKFMIVMTDGRYTESDPVPFAEIAGANGITIYTITFSDGANKDDMRLVANAGNGNHYHADDAADLDAVFRSLGGAISNLVQ